MILDDVLDCDAGLSDGAMWRAVEGALSNDGLCGITAKLEIGQHDLYLKTSWYHCRIVRVDITLSRNNENYHATVKEATLDATRFDLARSALESICKQASDMLQSGVVGIDYVINDWVGREMYPSGYCPQLPGMDANGVEAGATFQKGPTDAVAKYIRRNLERWVKIMESV